MNAKNQITAPGLQRLHKMGMASWALLGLIALGIMVAGGISALSGILMPLVVAIIIGTVLEPVVGLLVKYKVPRALAAVLALLLAIALAIGLIAIVIKGFLGQLPEITKQLMAGWDYVLQWVISLELEADWLERARVALTEYAPQAGLGLLGLVTSTVYGAISLGMGAFFAIFFLFFVLRDGHRFPAWFARVAGQDPDVMTQVDSQVRHSLLGYFRGTAVTALITGPIFLIPLVVLNIPLVLPIAIMYFFLSFIPFMGAWLTGVFAVLIAFGSGGPTAALIVALSLLVSNGTIQSAVSSWALGSSLKMHPVLVLLATLIGGVLSGIIGMVLGAPLLSAVQKSIEIMAKHKRDSADPGPDAPTEPVAAETAPWPQD